MSIEEQNKETQRLLNNVVDLTVKFREAKELIEIQAEEIEQLRKDKAFFSNQWEIVSKELNELKNK